MPSGEYSNRYVCHIKFRGTFFIGSCQRFLLVVATIALILYRTCVENEIDLSLYLCEELLTQLLKKVLNCLSGFFIIHLKNKLIISHT